MVAEVVGQESIDGRANQGETYRELDEAGLGNGDADGAGKAGGSLAGGLLRIHMGAVHCSSLTGTLRRIISKDTPG